ncbi:hypothetical protein PoB_004934500 [Plakobranchus ocellatus]|uniref:PX domain-containing protein n=1 Tax=Plakobranchus ocellatus TaxID=259542 RepID=A0AAV4BQH1_9GAST|nr:hypothetical protein PoB_004934500 [Plakobranchus ocellatus]
MNTTIIIVYPAERETTEPTKHTKTRGVIGRTEERTTHVVDVAIVRKSRTFDIVIRTFRWQFGKLKEKYGEHRPSLTPADFLLNSRNVTEQLECIIFIW